MELSIIVLAAGMGTRMNSAIPKVLHHLAKKPLLHYVIDSAVSLSPQQISVVVGHEAQAVQDSCKDYQISWVNQANQLGTGDAVRSAFPSLEPTDRVLVLYGDVPLIKTKSLESFINSTPRNDIGLITGCPPEFQGLGRIVRDNNGCVVGIVEEKDANDEQLKIMEFNSGILLVPYIKLAKYLEQLQPKNAQQEYYLTDVIAMGVKDKLAIHSFNVDGTEMTGVNNQKQLAFLENKLQEEKTNDLLSRGVKLYDPQTTYVRGELSTGNDVTIDVNCIFEGTVTLSDNVKIGPNCYIKDCTIGANVEIKANSMIEGSAISESATVGPFARVRPGSTLRANSRVGNFVEIKNTALGKNSKANHLSYLGDSEIGNNVNIGAGVITCNYDGANKHKTIIQDDVFVGSNSELIAPLIIGRGATIGAGTTVLKDAPEKSLTLTKKELTSTSGWNRPSKQQEK